MNKNPVKQADPKFGVPTVFNKIYDDLKKQINEGMIGKETVKESTNKDDKSFLNYFNKMKDQPSSFKPIYEEVNYNGGLKYPLNTKK